MSVGLFITLGSAKQSVVSFVTNDIQHHGGGLGLDEDAVVGGAGDHAALVLRAQLGDEHGAGHAAWARGHMAAAVWQWAVLPMIES